MADFGILQPTPNFVAAALAGEQAGRQVAKQRAIDAATANVDLERPESIVPLLRVDPQTGAALIGAANKLAETKRDSESRAALSGYLSSLQPGQAPHPAAVTALMPSAPAIGASGIPPVAGVDGSPGAPATPPTDTNEITVTATSNDIHPDAAATARQHLIETDPQKFIDIQENLAKMDKAQRDKVEEQSSAFAAVGQAAARLPYEQRRAYIQSQAPFLAQHGVPADQIASFDPNDQNIFGVVSHVLGVKGILDQQDKDRNFGLASQRAGEDARHNHATEGVAAGALGVAKSRESREARKATATSSDMSGSTTDALLAAAGLR